MKLLLERLKPYGFNSQRLTELDLYQLADSEGITVQERRIVTSFYISGNQTRLIVLSNRLKGLEKSFALAHELTHHFAHVGSGPAAFFYGMTESKKESEADAMATIALVPLRELVRPSIGNEYSTRFARQVIEDRKRLYFLYGI